MAGETGATGPQGPPASPPITGFGEISRRFSSSINEDIYLVPKTTFMAPSAMTCLVSTSLQLSSENARAAGRTNVYYRTAISRNGSLEADRVYGHYLISTGLAGEQPSASRTAIISIEQGENVAFGVFLGFPDQWGSNANIDAVYAYSCTAR